MPPSSGGAAASRRACWPRSRWPAPPQAAPLGPPSWRRTTTWSCWSASRRTRRSGSRSRGSSAPPPRRQDLVYKLSKVGQAIDKDDLAAAGDVLGPAPDAPWVQNVNAAFSKFSSSSEEKSAVDSFNSSLSSLFTSGMYLFISFSL
ncbi:hypothetical protein VPH35_130954 [Triticum aestivum]